MVLPFFLTIELKFSNINRQGFLVRHNIRSNKMSMMNQVNEQKHRKNLDKLYEDISSIRSPDFDRQKEKAEYLADIAEEYELGREVRDKIIDKLDKDFGEMFEVDDLNSECKSLRLECSIKETPFSISIKPNHY
jgi:hypothetical protein